MSSSTASPCRNVANVHAEVLVGPHALPHALGNPVGVDAGAAAGAPSLQLLREGVAEGDLTDSKVFDTTKPVLANHKPAVPPTPSVGCGSVDQDAAHGDERSIPPPART